MTINFDLAYHFLSKILHSPISYFSVPPQKKNIVKRLWKVWMNCKHIIYSINFVLLTFKLLQLTNSISLSHFRQL